MLYNYATRSEYDINIDMLIDILDHNKRSLLQRGYLLNANKLFSAWQRLFINLYRTGMHEGDINQDIEFFQKQINYGSMSIFLHFNIDYLRTHIHTAQTHVVPMDKIVQFANYELIPKSDLKQEHSSSESIFVVPFPKGEKRCLLVDGNHRISCALYEGKTGISVSNYSLNVAATSLMSKFEQAYYCYEFEVWEYESADTNYYPLEQSKVNWF